MLDCNADWRNSNSQGKRATRITRALSLTLVTLDCPSALDFAWDQSTSVSFRRVLSRTSTVFSLNFPRSSLRSFFFAATAVAFSSASLALVSASSAMAPSQDRHSASPATLISARHPSQATSLFLVAVVPEAMLAHLKHIAPVQPVAFPRRFGFVKDNLPDVLKTSISR